MRSRAHQSGMSVAVTVYIFVAALTLLVSGSTGFGQDDPFSIHVESHLVVVHTEVFDPHVRRARNPYYAECTIANSAMFLKLLPSQPYLPEDCLKEAEIHNLSASDFHVFEDGQEQKVERVRVEPRPWISVRDNIPRFHEEWSYTPRSKWSTPDLGDRWLPAPASYFYSVAYVPSKLERGRCHQVKVTVDHPDAEVFATDRYCYVEHPSNDPLEGTDLGKQLQADLTSDRRPKLPVQAAANYFYNADGTAHVDIVMEFPWDKLKHRWTSDGKLHASIGVLGVIHAKDGFATRFSDLAFIPGAQGWVSGTNPEIYDPGWLPTRYETEIDLPPGEYELRLVLSDGTKFGRAAIPLHIENVEPTQPALSSIVTVKRYRNAEAAEKEASAANLATAYVPLVSKNVQVTAAADPRFDRKRLLVVYFEVYDPRFAQQPTTMQVQMKMIDRKTGNTNEEIQPFSAVPYLRPGTTTFAVLKGLKVETLPKGDYRLEVRAIDSAGHITPWHAADVSLQ